MFTPILERVDIVYTDVFFYFSMVVVRGGGRMTQVLANSFKIILNFNIHYFYNHKIHVLFTRTVSPFRFVHMFVLECGSLLIRGTGKVAYRYSTLASPFLIFLFPFLISTFLLNCNLLALYTGPYIFD